MAAQDTPLSLGFSRQEHWSGLPFPSPIHESETWKWSRSVVSDSSRCRGLQPTRLLCPTMSQKSHCDIIPSSLCLYYTLGRLGRQYDVVWLLDHIVCVCTQLLSHVWPFVTPWTVACQAPLGPGKFPGKNTGADCHFLPQGIFLTQGSNLCLPHWEADSLSLCLLGRPLRSLLDQIAHI